jgi:hypothetical protein
VKEKAEHQIDTYRYDPEDDDSENSENSDPSEDDDVGDKDIHAFTTPRAPIPSGQGNKSMVNTSQ